MQHLRHFRVLYVQVLIAMVLGVVTLVAACTSKESPHRWLYGLTGVVSVLFGVLLLAIQQRYAALTVLSFRHPRCVDGALQA